MAAASDEATWRCASCSFLADVPFVNPSSPMTACADCGQVANPCDLLRKEVADMRIEIDALRRVAPVQEGERAFAGDLPMTAKEVAAYLKTTIPAVYMAARRGRLPCRRVGNTRSVRFLKSEIDAELARR